MPNLQYVIEDGTKAFGIIVEHMLNNSQVTIDELVGLTRISRRQMVRYVKELSDKGIIRQEGGRKLGKCTKNQKPFFKMYIMQLDNIKMTVGLQKSTGDKVQYCITAL